MRLFVIAYLTFFTINIWALVSPVESCSYTPGGAKDYIHRKHPVTQEPQKHSGVDLSAPTGTTYHSPGDGVITSIGKINNICGNIVEIKHGPNLYTHVCHLKDGSFTHGLQVGSRVRQGQALAQINRTGQTTGSHAHFVVKQGPDFTSHMDPYIHISSFCGVTRAQARSSGNTQQGSGVTQ